MAELLLVSGAKIDEKEDNKLTLLGELKYMISKYQNLEHKKILSSIKKIAEANAILEKQSQGLELTADEANLTCLDNLEGGPDMKIRFVKNHKLENKLPLSHQKKASKRVQLLGLLNRRGEKAIE